MLKIICVLMVLAFCLQNCSSTEENDLWLFISSYEDIGITADDLAFFLSTHGYNAVPNDTYVTVAFSNNKVVYLTPNGADPRLADLWMDPPAKRSGPVKVIPAEAIKANTSYSKAEDSEFIKAINRYVLFPVAPKGMCFDGSQQLAQTYRGLGYNIKYMYDPDAGDYSQGHLWILVEAKEGSGAWLAVDSYYGVMADDEYYEAPYSFNDIKYLDSINPKWKVA